MHHSIRHPLLILLLPLLLVFGQQAGMRHELSHLGAPVPLSKTSQQGQPAMGHGHCADCAGFAHLAGAITAPAAFLPAAAAAFISLHLIAGASLSTRTFLHRNRGPPHFL